MKFIVLILVASVASGYVIMDSETSDFWDKMKEDERTDSRISFEKNRHGDEGEREDDISRIFYKILDSLKFEESEKEVSGRRPENEDMQRTFDKIDELKEMIREKWQRGDRTLREKLYRLKPLFDKFGDFKKSYEDKMREEGGENWRQSGGEKEDVERLFEKLMELKDVYDDAIQREGEGRLRIESRPEMTIVIWKIKKLGSDDMFKEPNQ